jgi:hypothetical protein
VAFDDTRVVDGRRGRNGLPKLLPKLNRDRASQGEQSLVSAFEGRIVG